MRNMSFMLTVPQMRAKTKDVTRRLRWVNLKRGEMVMACVKCQGRRANEPLERIGPIRIHSTRWEPLNAITPAEVQREGFPEMTPEEFVDMFCKTHKGCTPTTIIHRISFRHLYE